LSSSQEARPRRKRARYVLPSPAARRPVPLRAVAKKVRTPAPPRRRQARHKRDPRKSPTAPQRSPWLYAGGGAIVAALIAAVIIGVVIKRDNGGGSGSPSTLTTATNYNALPGVRENKAPSSAHD